MEEEVPNAELYDFSSSSDPELAASPRLYHRRRQEQKKRSFLAGFRDCRQEVLHYLVSIEQVPLGGPVVFGLERHLTDLERFLLASTGCDEVGGGPCDEPRRRQGLDGGVESPNGRQTAEDKIIEEHGGVSAKFSIPIDDSSFDSGWDSSLVGSTDEEAPSTSQLPDEKADDERPQRADDTTIDESELAENALELMHLANSNPRINRILNELFVLMDNDYYDDDDDDDDDGIEMEEADGINLESQND